jgi:FkbM family methyltransferase
MAAGAEQKPFDIREHLTNLSKNGSIPNDHISYLKELKATGFEPNVIYDIGANALFWTREAKKLWPKATFVLFDAYQPCEFLYKDHMYHIGVLSDTNDNVVKFYVNDMLSGGNSYYREIGSYGNVFPKDKYILYRTETLDSVVEDNEFPLPDLVKIDVQGAEKDIITGGLKTLANAKHMLVEMQAIEYNEGAPLVDETVPFIESCGWKLTRQFCDNGPDADYGFVRK